MSRVVTNVRGLSIAIATDTIGTSSILIGDDAVNEIADAPTIKAGAVEINTSNPVACGESHQVKDKSLWGTFLLGIIGGLLALLTPCVWPMIPLVPSCRPHALPIRLLFQPP